MALVVAHSKARVALHAGGVALARAAVPRNVAATEDVAAHAVHVRVAQRAHDVVALGARALEVVVPREVGGEEGARPVTELRHGRVVADQAGGLAEHAGAAVRPPRLFDDGQKVDGARQLGALVVVAAVVVVVAVMRCTPKVVRW